MVRPASFGYNPETAASNRMQVDDPALRETATQRAGLEFDGLAQALRTAGVEVCLVEDSPTPPKPDAVFPNNWVSFHLDGTVVLYPMASENRRREVQPQIIETVVRQLGFRERETLDLRPPHESRGEYLEGTGSLVLDHRLRVAYACLSPRTHPNALEAWARALDYEVVSFTARDPEGVPLYHTNVMLCIGERLVVAGAQSIDAADRERVLQRLAASGRDLIEISPQQVQQFAGNMLELATWDEALGDSHVLVMSDSARRALSEAQYARLAACTDEIIAAPVPTIERLGGGSVRCMLAEVFRAQ